MRYYGSMRDFLARYVPAGSAVLALTTFASYVLGLLRDRVFAHTFGVGVSLDAYNAAFLVPDFLFNVLVASGVAAAVVPLFSKLKKQNISQAYAYIDTVVAAAMGAMVITGALIMMFAPALSHLVAPGLSGEGRILTIKAMRILAISPILFAASNALGAMLVAQRRFLFYGLSPVFYNLGIIGGVLFLAPRFGIMGVAYGTLLGALLHALVRLIDALRSGWRWRGAFSLTSPEFILTLRLMAPKMAGHPVELATFWVFTSLASFLGAGTISALNFARNFQSVPVSVLGITMATAVFPMLSEAALGSRRELKRLFQRMTVSILLISVLAAAVMFLAARPLVAILLGGGNFDTEAVGRVAAVLAVFCLSIPTESLSHLFARAFYAVQNTVIPVVFSVVSLLIAGGSAYVLMGRFGIVGLPLGFFLGSAVKTVGLYILFLSFTRR